MGIRHEPLRRSFGDVLRRARERWQLSLDDVERTSAALGIRITRSHLSRVENGQSDLALPRFLALMRAVGEPPGALVDALDALMDQQPRVSPATALERGATALRNADPAAAARWLRQAGRPGAALPLAALDLWAAAEAALGRWQAARRVLQQALSGPAGADDDRLMRLAVTLLAAGQPEIARPLARGIAERAPAGAALLEGACDLARLEQAARSAAEPVPLCATTLPAPLAGLQLVLGSDAYRCRGQLRAAAHAAERAVETAADAIGEVEARLALARAEAAARRPAAGLRTLERARTVARETGLPDLLGRCHAHAEQLHRLEGDLGAARQAAAAARAIARHNASDREVPIALPLHGLFRALGASVERSAPVRLDA